jgi:hypothetical protein
MSSRSTTLQMLSLKPCSYCQVEWVRLAGVSYCSCRCQRLIACHPERTPLDDNNVVLILQEVESGQWPKWKDIADGSPIYDSMEFLDADRYFWTVTESLDNWRPKNAQVVPPLSKVKGVLRELHEGSSTGHLGINKTLEKVRQQYYWLHKRSNARRLCQQCNTCVVSRGPWTGRQCLFQQCNSRARFERISMGIEWPFPENQRRSQYLLIAVDHSPSSRRFATSLTKKHWLWQKYLWPTPFSYYRVPRDLQNY